MEYLRLGWVIFVKMKDLTPIINTKSEAPIGLKFNWLAPSGVISRSGFFPIFLDFSTYSLANSWQATEERSVVRVLADRSIKLFSGQR